MLLPHRYQLCNKQGVLCVHYIYNLRALLLFNRRRRPAPPVLHSFNFYDLRKETNRRLHSHRLTGNWKQI